MRPDKLFTLDEDEDNWLASDWLASDWLASDWLASEWLAIPCLAHRLATFSEKPDQTTYHFRIYYNLGIEVETAYLSSPFINKGHLFNCDHLSRTNTEWPRLLQHPLSNQSTEVRAIPEGVGVAVDEEVAPYTFVILILNT